MISLWLILAYLVGFFTPPLVILVRSFVSGAIWQWQELRKTGATKEMSAHLERLVIEWRDAQKAIDRQALVTEAERTAALQRLVDAHNALVKYADEEMG